MHQNLVHQSRNQNLFENYTYDYKTHYDRNFDLSNFSVKKWATEFLAMFAKHSLMTKNVGDHFKLLVRFLLVLRVSSYKIVLPKVGCVSPMVIWSEFRLEQYRYNDHWKGASHFTKSKHFTNSATIISNPSYEYPQYNVPNQRRKSIILKPNRGWKFIRSENDSFEPIFKIILRSSQRGIKMK